MKNIIIVVIIIAVGVGVFAFTQKNKSQSTQGTQSQEIIVNQDTQSLEDIVPESLFVTDGTYNVDTEQSVLNWAGKTVIIEHKGTLKFKSGVINIIDGELVADVVLDMNSISSDTGEGLDTHLKSADFFDTENYPESTLSVTGYGNDMIKGNLTLNGITQPVLMPTEVVQQEDGSLLVTAQYSFDRTQFNITYSSGKLFQDLGDKAINDLIVFDTRIVANSATE